MKTKLTTHIVAALLGVAFTAESDAQTSAFTYQGQLIEHGSPANGLYNLHFTIYDSLDGGSPVGGPITNSSVSISNGLFTVTLDVGAGVFDSNDRWLEVAVQPGGGAAFTTLSPRQPITAAISGPDSTDSRPICGLGRLQPDPRCHKLIQPGTEAKLEEQTDNNPPAGSRNPYENGFKFNRQALEQKLQQADVGSSHSDSSFSIQGIPQHPHRERKHSMKAQINPALLAVLLSAVFTRKIARSVHRVYLSGPFGRKCRAILRVGRIPVHPLGLDPRRKLTRSSMRSIEQT